jgi:hypothetical protein
MVSFHYGERPHKPVNLLILLLFSRRNFLRLEKFFSLSRGRIQRKYFDNNCSRQTRGMICMGEV